MPDLIFETPILFAAGRLSLDFVNTLCQRRGERLEILGSPDLLHQWLAEAGVVYAVPLLEDQTWSKEVGARMLTQALGLRSALHDLVKSARLGSSLEASSLAVVNRVLRENPTYPQMDADGAIREVPANLRERWITEIARDAIDLLSRSDLSLLRQCECESCVRVFYDTTKNHRRRWCVEKCGNRMKAAAYYRRKVGERMLEL